MEGGIQFIDQLVEYHYFPSIYIYIPIGYFEEIDSYLNKQDLFLMVFSDIAMFPRKERRK